MSGLVLAFIVQTMLVYTDDTGRRQAPLSAEALAGRQVWLARNCQACHQIHGFGGFLGPDLTNASPRVSDDRLAHLLTEGSGAMPAFGLGADQIRSVRAYLAALNETGIGQARAGAPATAADVADAVAGLSGEGAPLSEAAARGATTFGSTCTACHSLGSARRLGAVVAPDLTRATASLSREDILGVLAAGRPDRGMPPAPTDAAGREDLAAFLSWCGEHREALVARLPSEDHAGLPWWEYR